jgi:hypothetical protein
MIQAYKDLFGFARRKLLKTEWILKMPDISRNIPKHRQTGSCSMWGMTRKKFDALMKVFLDRRRTGPAKGWLATELLRPGKIPHFVLPHLGKLC